jgi:hypothetical protein
VVIVVRRRWVSAATPLALVVVRAWVKASTASVARARVAGGGGEPGQGESAGLQRGDIAAGECQQRVGGGERAGERLDGAVQFEQGQPL